MITASFNESDKRVSQFLIKTGERFNLRVQREMKAIAIDLQRYVKKEKLEGGHPLNRRSGNLSRSINESVEIDSTGVTAIVGAGSSSSKYAKIHEFGGTINMPAVDGKLMVFTPKGGGAQVFTMKHAAYTITMPERSFLRSSLQENKIKFFNRLKTALAQEASK